jgi:hypothetical protein
VPPDQTSVMPPSGTYHLDQTGLGRRQQLGEHDEITAASRCDPERRVHVDADHMSARREPKLALACKQHVPSFVLLPADQGVLAVGAELSIGSGLASCAGQAVIAAGPAVLGPPPGWKCQRQSAQIRFLPRSAAPDGA